MSLSGRHNNAPRFMQAARRNSDWTGSSIICKLSNVRYYLSAPREASCIHHHYCESSSLSILKLSLQSADSGSPFLSDNCISSGDCTPFGLAIANPTIPQGSTCLLHNSACSLSSGLCQSSPSKELSLKLTSFISTAITGASTTRSSSASLNSLS